MLHERNRHNEKSEKRGIIAAKQRLDEAFKRKFQALAAVVTLVSVLVWAEVLSVPKKLLHLHQIITSQKRPRKGSFLLLLGWFLPLPRFLYWLGYLVPFLILTEDDEDEEIREYLAKRKRLRRDLRLFCIPAARQHYIKHFGQFYAYDLIPFCAKFTLIDVTMTVKETARIFRELDIEEAPLFDSTTCKIVGICTAKSFVHVMTRCTGSFVAYDARKLQSLTWHRLYRSNSYPTPARLHPSDDWNTTVNSIKSNPQKRAVMYEETNCSRNNPLMLLGVRRIYQYIYFKLETYKLITLLDMPINSLDIGTFNDLCCVRMDTNLKEIVATFSETGVTTLPVINHEGRFTYLLDTKLLFNLVLECPTKVRINVADVLKFDPEAFQPERQLTRVVYETDSLRHVITKLHDCNAHNVIVLDSEQKVTGIITITDMLLFLGFSVGAFKKTFKWAPIKTVD